MNFDQEKYRKRIPWIDNVKFIAIFCVVFGHFNGIIFTHGRPGFYFVNLLIVVFNMPLFVLMSGYSNYHSLIKIDTIKSLLQHFKKTILHIGLPCIIPCCIEYIMQGCHGFINFKIYWFLVMLFIMQIVIGISFFISSKICHIKKEILACSIFAVAMIMIGKYSTGELFLYYILGLALKSVEKFKCDYNISNHKRSMINIALLFLSGGGIPYRREISVLQ